MHRFAYVMHLYGFVPFEIGYGARDLEYAAVSSSAQAEALHRLGEYLRAPGIEGAMLFHLPL